MSTYFVVSSALISTLACYPFHKFSEVYFNSRYSTISFLFSDVSTGEESCKTDDPSENKRRRLAGIIIIK